MNLSQLAVRRPITVSVGVIVVVIFGLLSWNSLGLDLYPDLQLPYITIATVYPAADPQTVEEEVTRPVEDMVSTISGLRKVQSNSMENMSIVTAEFGWGTAMGQTLEDIRAHLSALALVLPDDAHAPFVTPIDPAQLPVMIIGLTSPEGAEHTTRRAANDLRPLFEQVPGVGQVTMLGGVQREIQVLYHSDKLEEHDLTPAMLEQFLSLQNALIPAGPIESEGTRFHTRVGSHFSDVQEIRDLVIGESSLPVQGIAALWPPLLHVKDVAEVVDGLKATAGSARIDDEHTVLFQVLKRPDANTVQVAEGVKRVIADLEETAPDINVSVITDQSVQIVSSLNNLALFGSFGALLAVAVLFLFLRSWRSIMVIGTAIPLSIIVTIAFLYFTGVTLNLMTLGGLSLGIGMLVDNSIIVLESIFRRRHAGATPAEAAIEGSKEVAGAVVAATVTTVVVFLPVLFMETFAARLFRELGLTVSLSLFASLLVSLTVVPAMAAWLFRGTAADAIPVSPAKGAPEPAWHTAEAEAAAAAENDNARPGGRFGDMYERLLSRTLNNRAALLIPLVIVIALSATLWPRLGVQFLPESAAGAMYISMETPPGTPLSRSEAVADEANARLQALDAFRFVTVQVGEQHQEDLLSILSDHGPTSIKMIAVGKSAFHGRELEQILRDTRATLADLPVESLSVGSQWDSDANIFSSDLVLQFVGADYETLESSALALRDKLMDEPTVAEIHVSLSDRQPEMFLAVDQSRALIGGLTTGQISLAVRQALTGVQATQVRQDGRTTPVIMRPHPDELTSLDDLLNFRVNSPVLTGMDDGSVRLGNVVEAVETEGPQTIRHVDGMRVVEMHIKPSGSDLRGINAAVASALEELHMPADVTVRESGVTELIDESMSELGFAVLFALILVYLVMVAQFESWRNPLIILTTTPLAALGVLWALSLTNTAVSVIPLLGLIILGGIVVNNGILLVDYISSLQESGMDVREAIVIGARTRLRPVLMTALTTIGGMLPLALSKGEGMEMQGPLAVTVIGGLLSATVLTLFVIPTLYSLLHEKRKGGSPSTPRRVAAPIVWLMALLLGGIVVGAAHPARAASVLSKPTVVAGIGYDVEADGPTYLLGAGWGAYVGDIDWTLYAAGAAAKGDPVTSVLGARGNWFQPISFAGYYELNGEISLRHTADKHWSGSLSLTGDAVLGNITASVEYDAIGAGFPPLPWDVPGRLPALPDEPGLRRLRGELRQQPRREFNFVREFQWVRRTDTPDEPGSLLVLTGVEARVQRSWLSGKVGLRAHDEQWLPVAEAGLRLRPGARSQLAVTVTSSTVWANRPALTATYDFNGERRDYSAQLTVQQDGEDVLQPSLLLQSEPHRGGLRWQLALDAADDERATSFGLFTTF